MDDTFIARIVDLFDRSTLSELEFAQGGARIRLARDAGAWRDGAPLPIGKHDPSASTPGAGTIAASAQPGTKHIVAGIPGTFYRAPGPGQAPFVEVGDPVTEGQCVGIIDAMKALNAIEAECAGVVVAIDIDNATDVDVGTVLVRVRPTDV